MAQDKPCVTPAEADAIFTALAPAMLRAVRDSCVEALPAEAYLVARGDQLIARYAAPAEPAKPVAVAAVAKILGPKAEGQVSPELFDSMAAPMIASMLSASIKPDKCPTINRVAELLDPLPPANLSGLVVLVIQLASKDDSKLPICKAGD
ncbi:MAG: hypothetical protein ABW023_09185 [Sphingomonas sp.]